MKSPEKHIPVLIVGGGPVGLFLAICLLKKGIQCRVIEKRNEPVPDSRSLGIHPVSLELFDELGITASFLEAGLKIKKGIAHNGEKKLGDISFERCPKPHNYILACPQFTTEKILRDELKKLDEHALVTKAEFLNFIEHDHSVEVSYSTESGQILKVTADWLIGCDGKNSSVRQQASIHYSGKRYPDTYIMGDFDDATHFGTNAVVFLPENGMIECFPLPNGMRRWVVKTDSYIKNPTQQHIAELVDERLSYNLFSANSTMLSSFGVQHFMAETFAKGRIVLAGDAAHVVSPIGGQGMNLGWLDARKIAESLSDLSHRKKRSQQGLADYSIHQKKIVKKAARRAEMNMVLGRTYHFPLFRDLLVKGMLNTPLRGKTAQLFTMRKLDTGWL